MTNDAIWLLESLCGFAVRGHGVDPGDFPALATAIVGTQVHIDLLGRQIGLNPDQMDAALAALEAGGYILVSGEAVILDTPAARWYADRAR